MHLKLQVLHLYASASVDGKKYVKFTSEVWDNSRSVDVTRFKHDIPQFQNGGHQLEHGVCVQLREATTLH